MKNSPSLWETYSPQYNLGDKEGHKFIKFYRDTNEANILSVWSNLHYIEKTGEGVGYAGTRWDVECYSYENLLTVKPCEWGKRIELVFTTGTLMLGGHKIFSFMPLFKKKLVRSLRYVTEQELDHYFNVYPLVTFKNGIKNYEATPEEIAEHKKNDRVPPFSLIWDIYFSDLEQEMISSEIEYERDKFSH